MTKDELIAALQAATGAAYVLDVAIAAYVRPDDKIARIVPPPYTASLDAALTLVPELWWWQVDSEGASGVGPPGSLSDDPAVEGIDPVVSLGRMLPPAIALCIVALRARA